MTHPTPSSESAAKDRTRTQPKAKLARRTRSTEHSKRASATKSGPGRYATHGEAGNRLTKQKPLRAYRALMTHFAGKRISKPGNKRGKGLL